MTGTAPTAPRDKCVSCGQAVRVHASAEGTCSYEPAEADALRAHISRLEAALREIANQEPCSCHCGLPVKMSERAREALAGEGK